MITYSLRGTEKVFVFIYLIYAFSRRFYPKRLTVHSRLYIFIGLIMSKPALVLPSPLQASGILLYEVSAVHVLLLSAGPHFIDRQFFIISY